jgi:hypothetical protein
LRSTSKNWKGLFENVHDLQRLIKTWCPEQNQLKRKQPEALSEEIEPNKKPKLEQPPITGRFW